MTTAIFWPMIAQAALTFAVYGILSFRRRRAIRSGAARASGFRENREEPAESVTARNSVANQFELPVLFYAVCLSLQATAGAGTLAVGIAWLFVLLRVLHAAIHLTTNRLRYRSPVFAAGYLAVAALWLLLAVHLV